MGKQKVGQGRGQPEEIQVNFLCKEEGQGGEAGVQKTSQAGGRFGGKGYYISSKHIVTNSVTTQHYYFLSVLY